MTQSDAALKTDCKEQPLLFQDLGPLKVVGDFSGGFLSSDGGICYYANSTPVLG